MLEIKEIVKYSYRSLVDLRRTKASFTTNFSNNYIPSANCAYTVDIVDIYNVKKIFEGELRKKEK